MPALLTMWADRLPSFAAAVVTSSDLTQPYVYEQLPAVPEQAAVARGHLARWAGGIGLSENLAQDIVLASGEAISNAIEHAYIGIDGDVTIFAGTTSPGDAIRVIVTDTGRWRPPESSPGLRGRGWGMLERLTETFRLAHTPDGTTVVLRWSRH
ncbi:ATP-binding protein [Kibdelosporangium phytohabitans]|uniref:Histidine kinase/HSP90-like ATPase domain-containing protein n=1 Tax=Kibdelosporangium phytohabitans TaxID=860235 RepID=A0A0N9I569_9PSEU|nr:ATP-binding protein [Kibdelosporangium phytohabitans]ALG09814.1 hypothetical protein AOZ06_25560 [Kibdelosporangium phytohabitans]MBE1468798.1 anti-sigma regulatory factor (Ser/Thr protein kinase) [Kibdelosporangium phytohabitans]